ncbi:hypothetical protein [Pseudomonas sp. UBA4617]|uniref:hypothetical protein n=1 Tax=Pseudomonas sp. UBA4617 TaxID=1947318 RepID=UPI0025FFC353|nr:hypothetical protein [Pseudomonas sp. UBA4617]
MQFKTHFQAVVGNTSAFNERNKHQCSMGITPSTVRISFDTRNNNTVNPQQRAHHNELMIGTWPQDIPDLLPLEAFFWLASADNNGLEQAKNMQRDLMTTAKLWVPVIRLNLKAANPAETFAYATEDQACTRTQCN